MIDFSGGVGGEMQIKAKHSQADAGAKAELGKIAPTLLVPSSPRINYIILTFSYLQPINSINICLIF